MTTSYKDLAYEPYQCLSAIEYTTIEMAKAYRTRKPRTESPSQTGLTSKEVAEAAWADATALMSLFAKKRDECGQS